MPSLTIGLKYISVNLSVHQSTQPNQNLLHTSKIVRCLPLPINILKEESKKLTLFFNFLDI